MGFTTAVQMEVQGHALEDMHEGLTGAFPMHDNAYLLKQAAVDFNPGAQRVAERSLDELSAVGHNR